ncbi:MAG: HpcH/HpaI aldolase/citrate lyase family protein [Oscillospiraceae bacterium]|jgi:citrate lyase beta subunit|nr:HpcH/HpaI aldolase/citrate lyase family protein [Oscillospiraceae bacterium]
MITKAAYKTGILMYSPATNKTIAKHFTEWKTAGLNSLCICLEDSVSEAELPEAEANVIPTLIQLLDIKGKVNIYIRVRNPEQYERFAKQYMGIAKLIDGFVFPKFNSLNALKYIEVFNRYYKGASVFMPTFETFDIMSIFTRIQTLKELRDILRQCEESVLSIRVGGADFSGYYGMRRRIDETIYENNPVTNCLTDIVNAFGRDYLISAPVYEFFGGNFETALSRETRLDFLNGFTGKTIIHPKQIPVVKTAMRPTETEYAEAKQILEGNKAVEKSVGQRMNEKTVHTVWAKRIYAMQYITEAK